LTLGQQQWRVEPQVLLDAAHGVASPSRADFVFWPQHSSPVASRPIAVFTDGYAYHVQPNQAHGEVGDDLYKRRAIVASGRFWVWSITWEDVEEFAAAERFSLPSFFGSQQEKLVSSLAGAQSARLMVSNGLHQLLAHLEDPVPTRWQTLAQALPVASLLPPRPGVDPTLIAGKVDALCNEMAAPDLSLAANPKGGTLLYAIIEHYDLAWLAYVEQQALQRKLFDQVQVIVRLEDNHQRRSRKLFKQGWRWFWLFNNLLQFAPGFRPLTAEAVVRYGSGALSTVLPASATDVASESTNAAWQEAFAYADPRCERLLLACQAAGLPAPTPGYELADDRGRVMAMVELGWEPFSTAVILPEQEPTARLPFAAAGWQLFAVDAPDDVVAAYQARAGAC
jgi:DEAD/DEAH box helicase domain-containing protein